MKRSSTGQLSGMDDTGEILIVVVASFGAVLGLIIAAMLCSWCFGKKKSDDDSSSDEESLKCNYNSVTSQDEDSDVRELRKRSWEDKTPRSSGLGQDRSPLVTRKTIKFERPERRVVTEHVQPSPSATTSLNESLGVHAPPAYQSMASRSPYRRQASTDQSPSSNKHDKNAGDSDDSMWKGVRSIATMLMDDGSTDEGATAAVTANVADGIDYQLGKIQLALSYDFQSLTLTLKVLQAHALPAKDFTGTSDPYVKILMLPDKRHKLLTKVKKKNLNPRWNECFLFEGWPHNKLLEKTLYLQVIDYDRFSRDDPIGETYIPLNMVDLAHAPTVWRYLQPCKDSRGKLGELLLSLCYQPAVGRLTVIVMKAKDLKAKDITGSSDPYVKLWLMNGKERVEKKKTAIKMRTLNPVFNESFIFEIPWEKIREATIEVTVMDFDRVGRNEMIGKILLGCRSGPLETRHWNDMVAKPRQQVAQWHLLKD